MTNAGKRLPEWLPWTMALLLLTALALLDRREDRRGEPVTASSVSEEAQVD